MGPIYLAVFCPMPALRIRDGTRLFIPMPVGPARSNSVPAWCFRNASLMRIARPHRSR
jgi:hypothetical protein